MDNCKRELGARRRFVVGAAIVCVAAPVMSAQRPMKDTMAMRGTAMSMLPVPLGVPMERMGSGTTWIPDAVSLYAAPSGEPALGPVAFMHRPSAMDNPAAPLGHHWQDATHVSFGVLTAGVFTRRVKLEASLFNGREPDENRWDFNAMTLDSYSGRVSINPTDHWSVTAGYGFLKSPEAENPSESMHRFAASVLHGTA